MTRADLLTAAAADLDAAIDRLLRALVATWQADPAMTTESTDPTGPWRRATVTEAAGLMRGRLDRWREQSLQGLYACVQDAVPADAAPLGDVGTGDQAGTVH